MSLATDMPSTLDIAALTHGWSGLVLAFGAVQLPMLAGMIRARAPLRQWPLSPLIAVPLAVTAGLCMSAVSPLFHGVGAVGATILQLTLGAGLSVGFGYAAGLNMARRLPKAPAHQRGTIVTAAGSGARPRSVARTPESAITLAGIPVDARDETKHFKFIGATGTGKSTAIQEILRVALRRGDRAIIADPDGGYLERFRDPRRGDVILNPFDRDSVKWDLFGEITNDYDVEQLARSLIPDHEGADRSWRGYARTFFVAVTRQAHAAGVRDVAELNRLLVVADVRELRMLVAGTPAQPFLEEHNGRMFDSIRSVTSSAVGALEYVGRQQAPLFSVRDWVCRRGQPHEDGGVLFIPYRAGQIAALRSTISAWMRLAIFEAMNRNEGDQRLWFVVDELDALGQIDGLKDALARLRKFGGRCVLGFQSISQVSGTYGAGEAQTIVENCGNTLILRCSASEHGGTSRFASQLIGHREVARPAVSKSWRATDLLPSTTRSEHIHIEPAVMDSEIEQLPDLQGYLKFASTPNWQRVALEPPAPRTAEESQVSALSVAGTHAAAASVARLCSNAQQSWRERSDCSRESQSRRQSSRSTCARTGAKSPTRDCSDYE